MDTPRGRIIAAAVDLFAEHGVGGTSLQMIADYVGVTKAAVSQITRVMAAELAPRIRVNAVLPGAIETAALARFLDQLGPEVRTTMHERTGMRRNGQPDDIASAALWLCSPAASWVTGQLVTVDGMAAEELIPKSIEDL